jgi:DNA-binding transcriptional regulator LsrR (DeoR family)
VQTAAMARLFYLEDKSKSEIAGEFGISRFKVARMLENAIRNGLIRLEIRLPAELDADLSDAMRTRFGLTHAIVLTSPEQGPDGEGAALVTHRLGAVAADLLTEIVTEGDVLGLVWGPEIEAMCSELTELPRCTVVQLSGVTPLRPIDANAVEAVRRAAFVAHGIAYPIYAPLLLAGRRRSAHAAPTAGHRRSDRPVQPGHQGGHHRRCLGTRTLHRLRRAQRA